MQIDRKRENAYLIRMHLVMVVIVPIPQLLTEEAVESDAASLVRVHAT